MIPPLSEITVSPSQFNAAQTLPQGLIDLLRAAAAAQSAAMPSPIPAPGGVQAAAPPSPTLGAVEAAAVPSSEPAAGAVQTAAPPSWEPTSGTAMMTPRLASPEPQNAVSNVVVAAYQGIQYWVDYGVQLAQSGVGFIPLVGPPVGAQIGFFYWDLIRPIANSIVYDLIVPVLNAPLNPGVWANGIGAVITASANALITFGWNELNYFIPLPPLPPLPSAAIATAAATAPIAAAEQISSIPSLVKTSLAQATAGPVASAVVASVEPAAATTTQKNSILEAASTPKAVASTKPDPPTRGAAAPAKVQTAAETPIQKPPSTAKAIVAIPKGTVSLPDQVRSDIGAAAPSSSNNLRPGKVAGNTGKAPGSVADAVRDRSNDGVRTATAGLKSNVQKATDGLRNAVKDVGKSKTKTKTDTKTDNTSNTDNSGKDTSDKSGGE